MDKKIGALAAMIILLITISALPISGSSDLIVKNPENNAANGIVEKLKGLHPLCLYTYRDYIVAYFEKNGTSTQILVANINGEALLVLPQKISSTERILLALPMGKSVLLLIENINDGTITIGSVPLNADLENITVNKLYIIKEKSGFINKAFATVISGYIHVYMMVTSLVNNESKSFYVDLKIDPSDIQDYKASALSISPDNFQMATSSPCSVVFVNETNSTLEVAVPGPEGIEDSYTIRLPLAAHAIPDKYSIMGASFQGIVILASHDDVDPSRVIVIRIARGHPAADIIIVPVGSSSSSIPAPVSALIFNLSSYIVDTRIITAELEHQQYLIYVNRELVDATRVVEIGLPTLAVGVNAGLYLKNDSVEILTPGSLLEFVTSREGLEVEPIYSRSSTTSSPITKEEYKNIEIEKIVEKASPQQRQRSTTTGIGYKESATMQQDTESVIHVKKSRMIVAIAVLIAVAVASVTLAVRFLRKRSAGEEIIFGKGI